MLAIPSKGFNRSVTTSNISPDILCDWIEANILFYTVELSVNDVVDTLVEEGICDDPDEHESSIYIEDEDSFYMHEEQHLARQIVQDAWGELERRANWIGNSSAYSVQGDWIIRKGDWTDYEAQTFCVLLSLASSYDWWINQFGHNYTEQGELFELLTLASLKTQFSGWEIHQTGWTRHNAQGLQQVVNSVSTLLGEQIGDLELWNDPNAKELGLDLLCFRPFPDNRAGIQVYLTQCASGSSKWKDKRSTPDLRIWRSVVRFTTEPKRAFAIPLSLMGKEFTQSAIIVDGLLIDRCRLLNAATHSPDWLSSPIKTRIVQWSQPRVDELINRSQ